MDFLGISLAPCSSSARVFAEARYQLLPVPSVLYLYPIHIPGSQELGGGQGLAAPFPGLHGDPFALPLASCTAVGPLAILYRLMRLPLFPYTSLGV